MDKKVLINEELLVSCSPNAEGRGGFSVEYADGSHSAAPAKGIEEIERLATAYGLILPKLYAKNGVTPKYQNPAMPHQTWWPRPAAGLAGRGGSARRG